MLCTLPGRREAKRVSVHLQPVTKAAGASTSYVAATHVQCIMWHEPEVSVAVLQTPLSPTPVVTLQR